MLTIDLRGDKVVLTFWTSPSALSVIFPTSSLEAISVTQGPIGKPYEVICEDALRNGATKMSKYTLCRQSFVKINKDAVGAYIWASMYYACVNVY